MASRDDGEREALTVRITGKGIDLQREIDVTLLPELMKLLFARRELVDPPSAPRHTSATADPSQIPPVFGLERPTGVVEYLREKRPQTSSDTILVLAGYLELHENRRPFGREDLRRLMRAGRLSEPANFPRDLGVAIAKGYLQSLDDGFQLTNSGLELLGHPGPLVAPRGRAATRARRGTATRDDREA